MLETVSATASACPPATWYIVAVTFPSAKDTTSSNRNSAGTATCPSRAPPSAGPSPAAAATPSPPSSSPSDSRPAVHLATLLPSLTTRRSWSRGSPIRSAGAVAKLAPSRNRVLSDIDGPHAAGKTRFANRFAGRSPAHSACHLRPVLPLKIRCRRGELSALGLLPGFP
jgi:hypothetical protein